MDQYIAKKGIQSDNQLIVTHHLMRDGFSYNQKFPAQEPGFYYIRAQVKVIHFHLAF